MRKLVIVLILLTSSAAYAARIWSRRERVQLTAARATSFASVIAGQLPACTNWRRGYFQKECDLGGGSVGQTTPAGTCAIGTLVTTLYPDCRYTPSVVADIPDGFQLETE